MWFSIFVVVLLILGYASFIHGYVESLLAGGSKLELVIKIVILTCILVQLVITTARVPIFQLNTYRHQITPPADWWVAYRGRNESLQNHR